MRRTFRHEAEGRTWWVERTDATLRIGFSGDSEPAEEVLRTRRASTAKAAQEELATLVREQLAEGFTEVNAPSSNETADTFYVRLQAAWKAASPHVASEAWLASVRALPKALCERFHAEWKSATAPNLTWPEANARKAWLRMQAEFMPAPFLLVLRDARGDDLGLELLELVPREIPHLEAALLAMIESLPPPRFPGHLPTPGFTNAMVRFAFSPSSVTRLVQLTHSKEVNQATNAAFILARYPHLSRRDVLEALQAWLAFGAALRPLAHAESLLEHAVPELGMALHRDTKRPRTHAELGRLLTQAMTTPTR